jgi:hypothetical protein
MVKIDGKVLNYKSSFKKESRSKPSGCSNQRRLKPAATGGNPLLKGDLKNVIFLDKEEKPMI